MPVPVSPQLTIPEIRAFLAVRSGLTVQTAADEARITPTQVRTMLARVDGANAVTTRGRPRR